MPRRPLPRLLPAFLAVAALACGPATPAAKHGGPSTLPMYEGNQADLFDDAVEPSAGGLELGSNRGPLRSDPTFRERAHLADGILRARLKTVSGKGDGPDAAFSLTLEPVERLGGKKAPTAELTLRIERSSRAFGLIRARSDELAGKTFVVFAREFSGVPPVWHAHLAPDTKEVEAAVKEVAALYELR